MNINDITVFAATARLGSITKASEELSTVQSNVTARIRTLEQELGAKLFHRNHTGVTLTHKGEELLPYAQQILALMQKTKEVVSEKNHIDGLLRIGSGHSTAAVRLPALLKQYVSKYSHVDITIETGIATELINKVLECRVDGAFISGAVNHPDLVSILAFEEELVVVTPLEYHSIAQYLTECPIPKALVLRVGCFYRQKLESFLCQEGVNRLAELEFATLDGIIGCVGAGLGIAMLPRAVIERSGYHDEVRMHTLPKEVSYAETLFVTHRALVRSNALDRLIDEVAAQRV
jgi:DNA-binding transcriptional LysR family regulator